MAGIHDGVVWQRKEYLLDRSLEIRKTAVGEVRPANAAGKKYVAPEHHDGTLSFADKHDMTGTVARRFFHDEPDASNFEGLPIAYRAIGWRANQIETVAGR